jgi:hypothetical protein
MLGLDSHYLEKLIYTWQNIEKTQRLDGIRALTRSDDDFAGYRTAYTTVGHSASIPYLGEWAALLINPMSPSSTLPLFRRIYSSSERSAHNSGHG